MCQYLLLGYFLMNKLAIAPTDVSPTIPANHGLSKYKAYAASPTSVTTERNARFCVNLLKNQLF